MVATPDPSHSPDSARQTLEQLVYTLLWFCVAAVVGYIVFSPIDPSLMPQRLIVVTPIFLSLFGAFALLRYHYLKQASLLVVGALWLALAGTAAISGGLFAPAFPGLLVVVILSGILLGKTGTWVTVLLSIGAGAGFVFFADQLPANFPPHSPISWFVTYAIYLSLLAAIITFLVGQFHQSLRRIENELSERRAVEQQLRLSEEKFARLFDSAPFAMLMVRLSDDLIVNANAVCRAFFGLSSDQIIKRRVNDFHEWQLAAQWPAIIQQLRAQGEIQDIEFSFRRSDGALVFAQLAAEIVELQDEFHAVVAFKDVTPLRRANERLAELVARQEQLATLAREALATTDLDALFALAAEQTAQTLHLSGVEVIEYNLDDQSRARVSWGIVPQQPVPAIVWQRLADDHPGWSVLPPELAERLADSDLTGAALPIRGQERLLGLLVAYTPYSLDVEAMFFLRGVANVLAVAIERANAEQERRQLETQMWQNQKLESLGLLAGGIAHDFNNLLTGIMGHTSLALLDLPPNHQLQPHLAAIDQASQRAAELCNQLLAYSGRGQRSREAVDLSALVREMASLLRLPTSRGGQVTIHYRLAPNLPPVMVEASQIRQVVLNLLTNAIEAIGENAGSVTLMTDVIDLSAADIRRRKLSQPLAPGRYVTLTVTDTGVGMDEATQRRIFDPFFSTKPRGHGLGLAAVQGIVRRHNGAIAVESTPGLGSTFTVYLPATNETAPVTTREVAAPVRVNGTALIVDDNGSVRATLSRILERAGMITVEAANGHTALTLLTDSALSIDIVLLDLAMPGMNGLELLSNVRQRLPHLPVLLMSGNVEQVTTATFPLDHYTDFLPKPYRANDVMARIAALIQRATTARER